MAKKIAISFSVVFAVVLAVIVFSLVGAAYSTDTAALLEEAKAYEAESNYVQAEAIYWSIVADYPGTDEAFQAQKNLAVLFITTGNYPAAQAEVDALIADFTGHQGLPQVIYDLANSWWYAAKFEESQKLFKYIVDNMPDSDLAIRAQGWVAGCDMKIGNYTAANQEIDTLMKDFADNPQLTRVIYKLAGQYWYAGRYEDSGRLYQSVLERDPESDLAVLAKGWITGLELILGDSISCQDFIETIKKGYAGQSQLVLGWILYFNAHGCWDVGKYKEARELYKYIADNLPESNRFMRAKACAAGADLILGNYAAAQQAIDSLITDFNDHPDLPTAVSYIEEGYYIRILEAESPRSEDYYREPVEVWEKVTEKFPDFFYDDPDLYYFIADCYHHLGKYEKAIEYFQEVIDNFPQHEVAATAQFQIAQEYGSLRDAGLIPESEAILKIEQAYQAVVEKYPYSGAVRDAAIRLGLLDFKKGQWLEAIQYFELALKKSKENRKPVHILYPLGRVYEELGQLDKAAQVYNQFITAVPPFDPRIEKVKFRLEQLGS